MYELARLVNLKQRQDLNAKCGVIVDFDKSSKRYAVKLNAATTVCVKPENMRFVHAIHQGGNRYLDSTMKQMPHLDHLNLQVGPDDFHAWNITRDGKIEDAFAKKLLHLKLTYKEWVTGI